MPGSAAAIGRRGERAVRRYLRWRGWRILGCNVRLGRDELDVVAVHGRESMLAIVEVKSTSRDCNLIDRVDYQKQCRIARASERLPQSWVAGRKLRFDVAMVRVRWLTCRIQYVASAFDDPR